MNNVYTKSERLAFKAGCLKAEKTAEITIEALRREVVGLGDELARKPGRAMEGNANSALLLWAMLGVTSHTEASQKVAQLLAQKELIERLEARITELKDRDADFE